MKKTISTVLLFILITTGAAAEPVITEASYDIKSLGFVVLTNDWLIIDGGAGTGNISIISEDNTLSFTRSDLVMTNQNAFLVEAVMSAQPMGADGELGARMWANFRSPGLPPGDSYCAEIRLVREAGTCKYALVDSESATVRARITNNWTQLSPRHTVGLRRQTISGVDTLFFYVDEEVVSVPVVGRFRNMVSATGFGFGNIEAGNYYSEWEHVRLIHSTESDTYLPPPVFAFSSCSYNSTTGFPEMNITNSPANTTICVQRAGFLIGADWQNITNLTGSSIQFVDSTATGTWNQLYYRLKSQP